MAMDIGSPWMTCNTYARGSDNQEILVASRCGRAARPVTIWKDNDSEPILLRADELRKAKTLKCNTWKGCPRRLLVEGSKDGNRRG